MTEPLAANIDLLTEMLLRSREIAVDENLDQLLPALDAAIFIAGHAMADRMDDSAWAYLDSGATLN
ncbi:hypothetical protein IGS74_01615 [Aureimonas sp. OT7]|uniref:Uncharacterized protein n=1 Tax=Aureimonas altamirensis TaxID=370622 RepID=A0A0B1Q4M1_9HYPH|nr:MULTISPECIES: hypothetical protein [Aureimonas]KHJ53770.1 hypothetical protein LA66_14270 [Aureimonas altamirensis]QOG07014.1 hypothetical protein IGS74_01615 [Aureimonas sp. OT7]